jgi:hypothetical protein
VGTAGHAPCTTAHGSAAFAHPTAFAADCLTRREADAHSNADQAAGGRHFHGICAKGNPVKRTALLLSALGAALPGTLQVETALAQSRAFVAAQGSDTNPCTFAKPCRTFQHAHDTAAAGGEIDVLDPAGYGAVTITKAISIQGHGFAGITPTSTDAVTINAGANDRVSLRGLLIDGGSSPLNGITFNSGASLVVEDTLVRNVEVSGINFQPSASSSLVVSDSTVSDGRFASTGIAIGSPTAAVSIIAILTRVSATHQSNFGLFVGSASSNDVSIMDSVFANNGNSGINVNASGQTRVMVRNSAMSNNFNGVVSIGAAAIVRVSHSVITANDNGWFISGGGTIQSYGDNNIDNNVAGNSAPPSIPTK